MPSAIKCELLLYADGSVLLFTNKNLINEQLNSDFNSLGELFVDNKLRTRQS